MRGKIIRLLGLILIGFVAQIASGSAASAATSCDSFIQHIDADYSTVLEGVILKQQKDTGLENVTRIKIIKIFKDGNWSIILVETYVSDEPYLFYSDDPLKNQPITSWSGAATIYDEKWMKNWILKNAPGIPDGLANCFARRVTIEQGLR